MYFPIRDGKYLVEPGLRKLGDDEPIFLITQDYKDQIRVKWCYEAVESPVYIDGDQAVIDDILLQAGGRMILDTGLEVQLGLRLGMQVQEDLAIIQEQGDTNKVIYLHVSFPNGWDPAEKIGGTFASIHEPVAHFDRMAANESRIVKAMIDHGPFERFAWGVHTTDSLDRLAVPDEWEDLDPKDAVFRVERQTTLGFPEHRAALFTIHTQFRYFEDLEEEQRKQLADALDSMDEEARAYKGLTVETIERLTAYLRG